MHVPHAYTYANAAARTGATGFVAGDVGKIAFQSDDKSLWALQDTTPTWTQLNGAGGGVTTTRAQFREYDISAPLPAANEPFNINTGVWDVAGAQSTFASYGTLVMPATAAAFRDDTRFEVLRNGVLQSKGATAGDARDVYPVSTTPPKIAFNLILKPNDEVKIMSPSTYV